jgi:hypothetical protein
MMPMSLSLAVGLIDMMGLVQQAAPVVKPCREHPLLAGKCFRVRGRMNYWNGSPAVRIWPVGTKRMLGVSDGRFVRQGYENLPPDINAQLSWESDLFADFTVCPFTHAKPGEMQLVCVDSAVNRKVRQRDKEKE